MRLEENVVGLLHPYETTRAALASVGIDRALESGDRVRVRVLSVDKEERTLVLVLAGGSHAPPREAALSPAEAAPSTGLQERVPGATAAEEESAITSEDVEKSPEDKEACAGESAPASEPTGPAEASTDAGAGASKLYRYYDDDSFDLDGEDAPEDIDDDIYLEDEDEDEDELTGLRDEDGLDLEAELGDLLPMALSGQASMAEVAEVARQVGYYALATLAHCTSGRGSSNEVRGGQTLPRWRVGAAMAEIAARRPCSTADSPPSSDAARPTDDTDMTLPRDLETALRALFSAPDDPLAYTVFGACVPSEWLVAHRSTIEELIRSNAHPSYRPWIPGLRVVEARAASGARRLIAAHRLLNEAIDEGGRRTVMRERNELVGRFPDALDQEQVFSGADGTFTRDLAHNITLGSFAAVIPVKAADTEVRYALKHYLLLDEGSKKMEESLGLFEREATMLARVGSHPNIVNYYGRLAPGMILLEWIPGDTLAHALQARIPGTGWPAARCMDLAFRVASAIHRLESEFGDFVHHDLAPRNIMVDERSTEPDWVKIIDLGLARSRSFSTISTAIREINVRRRKDHWPPEWVEGARPAAQGDMYALGLVVLEALGIGEPLDSLRGASPDELARLDPGATGLSTPGWRALQHLLARRPEERPGTWKTVMDELEEALDATA